MDLDAIVARCESRFRDTDNSVYLSTEWEDYARDAEADVYAASPWWHFHETRDTAFVITGGTSGTALPSDAVRVNAVWNATDGYPLSPLDGRSEYRHAFPDPANHLGNPLYYRFLGNTLEVYPRPASDVTLEIDYMAAPAVMVDGTDEPAFPETYHRMLVSGALAYAYEDDGNDRQVTIHRAKFEQLLLQMMNDLLQTRTERYHAISDDFGL